MSNEIRSIWHDYIHRAEWPFISKEVGAEIYQPLHNCLRAIGQEVNRSVEQALLDES